MYVDGDGDVVVSSRFSFFCVLLLPAAAFSQHSKSLCGPLMVCVRRARFKMFMFFLQRTKGGETGECVCVALGKLILICNLFRECKKDDEDASAHTHTHTAKRKL